MLTQLLWIHLASLFLHTVASLASATSLAATGRILLSPPSGKAIPLAPQYWRHHPDLSGFEPATCLNSLMASDVCPHPLHTHPAHCPTHFNSSTDPRPQLPGHVGTGSGGDGNSPLLTNQQLRELSLCAPRIEGPECCVLPTRGAEHRGGWSNVLMPLPCLDSSNYKGSKGLQILPPQWPLLGQFPRCAEEGQGSRSSCVVCVICGWEADRLAPLLAAHAPRRLFLGLGSKAYVHGCIQGQGQAMGLSSQGGGAGCPCRRAQHGHNPTALAVSSCPSTVALVVLIDVRG